LVADDGDDRDTALPKRGSKKTPKTMRVVEVGDDFDMDGMIDAYERGASAPKKTEDGGVRVVELDDDFDFDDDDDDDDDIEVPQAQRESMAARIAAAEQAERGGKVRGYYEDEENADRPADEPAFYIDVAKNECPGCGAKFQSKDGGKPGYLPPEVLSRLDVGLAGLAEDDDDEDDEQSAIREVEELLREARGEVIDSRKDVGKKEDVTSPILEEEEEEGDQKKKERTPRRRRRRARRIS